MKNQNYAINQELPIHQDVIERLKEPLAIEIYKKLLNKKRELLNQSFHSKARLNSSSEQRGGDSVDQVNQINEEVNYAIRFKRDTKLLDQVTNALERMKNGLYGICDQTHEVISEKRLLSLPWTRLSIEGAEIEESNRQSYR